MKRESFNRIAFCICIWFISLHFSQAQDPVFSAIVTTQKVVQNSVIEVQFELKNASGDNFIPPDFRGFRVVGGPSIGSSTMIINGEVTRSESWTYSLLAAETGKHIIGSATVIAGRRKLASKPIEVEVVTTRDIAASNIQPKGDETVFLRAEIDKRDYYPGQQIKLNYRLIFKENIQTANVFREDDYADFFLQNFNPNYRDVTYETINSQPYASKVIRSVALYAHQSGTYTIEPMVIEVGVNAPYPVNQGFFTMRRLKNIQVASEPLTITILPLPANAPEGFSGAVGAYTMEASAGNTQLTTDDDFTIEIKVEGDGDARRWDPPTPVVNDDFELYDPEIKEENVTESMGRIIYTRTIRYKMIPQRPGSFDVTIPFVYFNPENKSYETLTTETYQLQVAQGQGLTRRIANDTTAHFTLPLRDFTSNKTDDRFWLSIPHLSLFGVAMLGLCFGLMITYRRKQEQKIPAAERKRSAAAREARHQLEELEKNDVADKLFYEKATEIYVRFLEEKFTIAPADLDKGHLISVLTGKGFSEYSTARAVKLFDQTLLLRYGAIPPDMTKGKMITEIREIIDELGS